MINHHTNNAGFSLLELVIGIMISSVLMTAALTIYNQIGKGAIIIQKITSNDTKIIVLHDRLCKDLAGISSVWFTEKTYENLKHSKPEDANEKEKMPEPKKDTDQDTKQNIFLFDHNKDNNLDYFTFITTNPLHMYGDKNTCFVRVVYKLVHDTKNENLFKLMRKQDDHVTQDIDKEKIKDGLFYELANNISKFSIEYGFTIPSPQEQEKNPEKKLSFKWIPQWNHDSTPEQKKEYQPACPEALKLKISFVHELNKQELSHELFFIIPSRDTDIPQSFIEKKQKNSPNAKQLPTPKTEEGPK